MRRFLRRRQAYVVALTGVALLLAGATPVRADASPQVEGSPQNDFVRAQGFAPGAMLTFTIRQSDGGTILFGPAGRTADSNGHYFLSRGEHGLDLVAGRHVEVADGTTTRAVTLENLGVTQIDQGGNVVSGTSDADEASIQVSVFSPSGGSNLTVAADGAGNWSADFDTAAPPFDVDAQTSANARIVDAEGDATVAELGPPSIHASLSFDNVFANNFAPSSSVTFTIRSSPGGTILDSGTKASDSSGNAFFNRFGDHNVDLVPGMEIEATDGTATKTLTLVALTIDAVNPSTDDVSGTASAGTQVQVNVNQPGGGGTGTQVTAAGDGSWTADFSGLFDITGGTGANASVRDADGDTTGFDKQPATIHASLTCDCINANNFAPNASVTFTIRASPGGVVLASGTKASDSNGNAFFNRFGDHNVDLVAGLEVEASDGTATKTLTLVALTIETVDPATDDVTGTAPAAAQVDVNVNEPGGGGTGTQVTAAGDGTWTADFSGMFDIGGGTNANAFVADADGDSTSVDRQAPLIHASLTWDGVNASNFAPNASVTFTIRSSPGGTVLASGTKATDGTGHADFNRFQDHDVDLVPGLEVEVTDGTATKTLTLVALTIDAVNPSTDDVSGTAPAGAQVHVDLHEPGGGAPGQQVTAAGDGSWTADFSGVFDIGGGTGVTASVGDADGDSTSVDKQPASIHASLTFDGINANNFAPNAGVTFTIRSSPGGAVLASGTKATDSNGNANFNRFEDHGVDLVAGLEVEATDGTATKTLTLAALTIETVDPASDDVTGTAPASAQVDVNVNQPGGGGTGTQVTAAGDGSWTADFSGLFDITAGTGAQAFVRDADGDQTSVDKPPASFNASLTFDGIFASGFAANASVTFTIRSSPGGAVLASGTEATDSNGNASFERFQDHEVDLVPGMAVEVTDGAATKELTLVTLTIDTVDPATDDVSGTAPASAQVEVNVNQPGGGGTGTQVTAAGDGSWTADFTGLFDITAGTGASAFVRDADGDGTVFDKEPPNFDASLTCDCINAFGFAPNDAVTFTIREAPGGAVLASGTKPTDGGGHAEINRFEDFDVDLVPGMHIEVTDGTATKDLTLVTLTIDVVDAPTDVVSGTAPAGADVQVNVGDESGGTGGSTTADGSGNWSIDYSPFDVTAGMFVDAHVGDADGDSTGAEKEPANFVVDLIFDGVFGGGFAPNASVEVEVRDAPGGTVLFTDAVSTDSNGSFEFNLEGALDLVAGNEVTVSDGFVTKVHVAVDLTIDTVDAATDDVSGSAPTGTKVHVSVGDETEVVVTADGSGAWTADFSGLFDIDVTTVANATVFDDDGDATTVEKQPPVIHAFLDFDGIEGYGFTPNSTVTVEIRSAPGVNPPLFTDSAVPTDSSGAFFLDPFEHGVDLVPGMAITVTGSTKLLVLVDLTIDPIDPSTDVVSGTAPPGAQVDLFLFGPSGETEASVTADGSGVWSVDFTGTYDIEGRTDIGVSVPDSDGDRTRLDERRPAQIEWASLSHDSVCPRGFGGVVTVEIKNAGGKRLWKGPIPDGLSGCVEPEVHGQDLVAGMLVSATDGAITKTLTLATLTIDSVNAETGIVSGSAPAGAQVALSFGGPAEPMVTVDAPAGQWTADLSEFGLTTGVEVWALVSDSDGDNTQAARQPAIISANLTLDEVNGCGFALDSSVTVTIDSFSSAPFPTDGGGCFGFDASAQDLETGMSVSVTDGTITRELDLPVLTMNVDFAGGVISGTAPPNAEVLVGFGVVDEEKGDSMTVTADGAGNWTADFGELEPNLEIQASVRDSDGDSTDVSWFADLRFSVETYSVAESNGSVTITVERSGTAHVEVGVSFATSDGSATASSDYEATSGTLAFPDGVTSQTFTVPIVDDTDAEGDEVVNLTLSDPTGGAALATPSTATITIQDDDGVAPTLAFSSATYSVGEGGGRATITVQRSGDPNVAVGVSFATSDGTATAGSDYTAASGTLAFSPGEMVETFDVRVTDDAAFEGDETVNLVLSAPTGGAALEDPSAATLTIVENEAPPTVQFAQATYSTLENGAVALTVTRAGPTGNPFSVDYALVPGTATEGSDFTFTPGTLAFGKNDTSKVITVPITNDGASESAEDFGVQLAPPSGGVALGSPSEATVVIAASDQQPDAMVSASAGTGFLGDNVYNTTGDGQTLSTTGARNATTVVYFRIQNDGTSENTLFVGGPSSPAKTTLRYFLQADGSEITSLVQSGAFQTTLPAGGHVVIRAELAISSKVKVGSSIGFSVTGTWTGDAVRQDTARAVVGVAS